VNQVLYHPSAWGDTKSRAEKLRTELEVHLTLPQIESIKAQAQSKTLETSMHEILASPAAHPTPSRSSNWSSDSSSPLK
jgi:hypothetical protein